MKRFHPNNENHKMAGQSSLCSSYYPQSACKQKENSKVFIGGLSKEEMDIIVRFLNAEKEILTPKLKMDVDNPKMKGKPHTSDCVFKWDKSELLGTRQGVSEAQHFTERSNSRCENDYITHPLRHEASTPSTTERIDNFEKRRLQREENHVAPQDIHVVINRRESSRLNERLPHEKVISLGTHTGEISTNITHHGLINLPFQLASSSNQPDDKKEIQNQEKVVRVKMEGHQMKQSTFGGDIKSNARTQDENEQQSGKDNVKKTYEELRFIESFKTTKGNPKEEKITIKYMPKTEAASADKMVKMEGKEPCQEKSMKRNKRYANIPDVFKIKTECGDKNKKSTYNVTENQDEKIHKLRLEIKEKEQALKTLRQNKLVGLKTCQNSHQKTPKTSNVPKCYDEKAGGPNVITWSDNDSDSGISCT